MKVNSSYIFLPRQGGNNNKDKKDKDDKRAIRIKANNITSFLHKAFPDLQTTQKENKLFETQYELEINNKGNVGNALFILHRAGEATYLKIQVENRTNKKAIELLEEIQNKLFLTDIRKDYLDIISFDGVSEHYCNKLYSELGKLERLLRSLLLKVYTLNYKQEYYEKFNTEIINKAKGNIRVGKNTPLSKGEMRTEYEVGGKKLDQLAYAQHFFESLDFNTLETLLFTKRTRDEDLEKLDEFLSNNDDLSEVSDSVLRNKYNAMRPQSDWERLFREKVGIEDMKESLDEIREIRNRVAHCRPVCKADYDRAKALCKTINKALEKAITLTEDEDFRKKNLEELRDVSGNIAAAMTQLSEHIQGMVGNVMKAMGDVSISNSVSGIIAKTQESLLNAVSANMSSALSSMRQAIPPQLFAVNPAISALQQQVMPTAALTSMGDAYYSALEYSEGLTSSAGMLLPSDEDPDDCLSDSLDSSIGDEDILNEREPENGFLDDEVLDESEDSEYDS